MPAPRPTSSTPERSYTSQSQPIWRRKAAVNRPDIEPPMMMARRLRAGDELDPGMARDAIMLNSFSARIESSIGRLTSSAASAMMT